MQMEQLEGDDEKVQEQSWAKKAGPMLRELAPPDGGSQEAVFTQPRG